MKFALVNGSRCEAAPLLRGECPSCGAPLTAKCGGVRVHHWAHSGRRQCDHWWEPETAWHRAWKNEFPKDWQEIVQRAPDGELHIADVITDAGWVFEFQHSYISQAERRSRETFYTNLIWIVDGSRRSRDKKRFLSVFTEGTTARIHEKRYPGLKALFPEGALLRDWIHSPAQVFFDFGDADLYWLLPGSDEFWAFVLPFNRNILVGMHAHGISAPDEFGKLVKQYCGITPPRSKSSGTKDMRPTIDPLEALLSRRVYRRTWRR